jgi:superfamily II DNA or RNA helicase
VSQPAAVLKVKTIFSQLSPLAIDYPGFVEVWSYLDVFLSYEIHNNFFIKAMSNKSFVRDHWDGRNHLFSVKTGKFLTGVLPYVEEALKQYNIPYIIEDDRMEYEKHSIPGLIVEPRPYQEKAVDIAYTLKRGILWMRPRSGKTLVEIMLVQRLGLMPVLSICQNIDIARQTIAKFNQFLPKVKVGLIGDGECDIQPITVATIQSLSAAYDVKEKVPKNQMEKIPALAKKLDIQHMVETSKVVWVDECFPKGVKVLTAVDSYMSIEKIVENPQVTQVLSYDLKTHQIVQKRILRKIKVQKSRKLMHIEIDVDGQIKTLNCTRNHKIWTTNGYIAAEDLTVGDEVKYFGTFDNAQKIFVCPECGLAGHNGQRIGIHRQVHKDYSNTCSSCGKFYTHLESHMAHHRDPELGKKIAANINYAEIFKKREQNGKWRKSLKEMGKRRQGKNNPVFRYPDTIEKIRKSSKVAFDKMSEEAKRAQIVRFRNAPKYHGKMTKPERRIANLGFTELVYVGNGKYCKSSYIYEIEDPKVPGRIKRKIPDFIVKNTNKVIEVADRTYWHTEKEMDTLIVNYAAVGIKCLVIYADEISADIDKVRKQVFTFIHNHTARVVKVRKFREAATVYNLEIEDTHNYFANGILVSNCHHATSSTHKYILQNKIYSAEYILGCSGTPFREDNTNMLLEGLLGPIIYEIDYSNLIDTGYLVRPTIHLIKLPKIIQFESSAAYPSIYSRAIVENTLRNETIARIAHSLKDRGKTCMILVNKINHGKILAKLIPCSKFSYSKSKDRASLWHQLKVGKLSVLITTLGDEGIDIPSLGATIIASGGESAIKVFQRLRCLTPYGEKHHAIVVDFMDPYKYLSRHSKKREKLYRSESSFRITYKDVKV